MNDPSAPALADPYAPASGIAPGGIVPGGILPAPLLDEGGIDAQSAQPALPADHPAWQRDVLAISARARAVLARLRPVVVRVVTFWDHAVRGIVVGGDRKLEIDPSGCYRLR